ncbi:MAG: dehydrogenase [Chitinophagales bacterium]|nr:dehydrogenase [Chitinophagales bacterium]
MDFSSIKVPKQTQIDLYKNMLYARMIEEKMLNLLRQGKISKWFSGIGQEAIAVGVTKALHKDEYILPMHRNLGVFTSREIPLAKLVKQWQGKPDGFTKGRDRSFHFGTNEYHIVGMISHLGPQLNVGDGIALASKLKNEGKIAVAFTGEGGTSEGDFHEALNLAAVWQLPIIFVVENNGYGLSTPTNEQYNCQKISDRGIGYGMKAITIDGNNVLEVYETIKRNADSIRENPEPILIECQTFRMRGHEEASGTKYVPKKLMEEWAKKDPIDNFEVYILAEKILSKDEIVNLKETYKKQINEQVAEGFDAPDIVPNIANEINDVFKPFKQELITPKSDKKTVKRMIDAYSDALYQSMEKYDSLVLMGQDIAEYGGAFKITEGFVDKFGKERVRNTPIMESGVLSAALGMSIKGMKTMVEMQFADFVSSGFNPIINNLAKSYYRWGQNADVVIRMPTGAGVGAGPYHSQSNEAWFYHTPGLKIVYPSNPYDAKGLLNAAIEDPNPVMVFEHKALYRSIEAEIPDDYYTVEIGKAIFKTKGKDVSIITYGAGVHWALALTNKHENVSVEVLDLCSLIPLDYDAIKQTVQNTGKIIVLNEDCLTGSIASDIAAWIGEHCFEYLDAPVKRVGSLDTPIPFSKALENQFLPQGRLEEVFRELIEY